MNRIVTFGLTAFFALIGICLIDGPEAKAFHGWQMYGGWGCQGCHAWHANQRCYSCSGCSGCYGSAHQCCASNSCGGCWSYSGCYGCYRGSCHGCYGACDNCGGYYRMVIPMIVVPVEPAPPVASASMKPASEKAMLQLQPSYDPYLENFVAGSVLGASDLMTNVSVVDQYIHEPR